ncbi:dihydrofolate reductase family protein [Microterricola viridarii]|uniref:Dihydrofolate reductase n=1 Tax=Microterricola viridarii TaxID=412690 RepID=A0A1H1PLZ3_9MICO|nr:dihydrofolate reductase family protein [Microterricola viridarii]SDS12301.1 Dihydrofolate reductase [Microterricola viridarii]
MAALIYTSLCSLDGFTADAHGSFEFAMPDEEVHRFANELERSVGTHLYGRRMYEVMTWWEATNDFSDMPGFVQEYAAVWQAADKIVYSRTLTEPAGPRTRIERRFDVPTIRELKAASARDISVSGPTLASHALRAGLVDEVQLLVFPFILGGGLHMFPEAVQSTLELTDERRFDSGVVYLGYRVRRT